MHPRRGLLTACAIALLAGVWGCRDETPTGQINPGKIEVAVQESATMTLELSSKYHEVQREIWKVEPETLGKVYYNQSEVQHRTATFRGETPGTGKIVVMGFWGGNTTPTKLAEAAVTVK